MNEYIHIAGLLYIITHVQKGLAKTVEQVLRSGVALPFKRAVWLFHFCCQNTKKKKKPKTPQKTIKTPTKVQIFTFGIIGDFS